MADLAARLQRARQAMTARPSDAVVLETLRSAPPISLTMMVMVGLVLGLCWGHVGPTGLVAWAALVAGACGVHEGLLRRFRRLQPAGQARLVRWLPLRWADYAWYVPVVFGGLAMVVVVAVSTSVSMAVLMVLVVWTRFLTYWSVGPWASSHPGLFWVTMLGGSSAWLLNDISLGLPFFLIMVAGIPAFPTARSRGLQVAEDRHAQLLRLAHLEALLQQRNAQLQTLSRNRAFLLEATSHDLRQPVHALGLQLQCQVQDDAPERRPARDLVVRDAVGQLSDMLRNLLDVSQLDAGLFQAHKAEFDLAALVEDTCGRFDAAARRKQILLRTDIDALRTLRVYSDAGLLSRMLDNLVRNAVRFTDAGYILVQAQRTPDGDLLLAVQDTGRGIARGRLPTLFQAWAVQLSDTGAPMASTSESGLGVGLAVVQKGAALLGLALGVESQEGEGSRFLLRIPSAMLRSVPHRTAGSTDDAAAAPGLRVLLAEDDEVIRTALLALLRQWGHQVEAVENLEQARACIAAHQCAPQLVLSDYQLGQGMDGLQLIEAIRAVCAQPALPAILVTGNLQVPLDPAHPHPARVLHKPVRPRELREALASYALAQTAGPPDSV